MSIIVSRSQLQGAFFSSSATTDKRKGLKRSVAAETEAEAKAGDSISQLTNSHLNPKKYKSI